MRPPPSPPRSLQLGPMADHIPDLGSARPTGARPTGALPPPSGLSRATRRASDGGRLGVCAQVGTVSAGVGAS